MRLGLGQFNSVVGDMAANVEAMSRIYRQAMEKGIDLLVFPELAVCGYPPEDLLHKRHFLAANEKAVRDLAAKCPQKTIIVGFPQHYHSNTYNAAAVLQGGKVEAVYRKGLLPNYGIFDEGRYFRPGAEPVVFDIEGVRIALTICADIWTLEWMAEFFKNTIGIQLIVNISASPFHAGKIETRREVVADCAKRFKSAVCYCNLVGGQDELVFDGRSIIADPAGKVVAMAKAFEEDLLIADIEPKSKNKVVVSVPEKERSQPDDMTEEMYAALVLGTRDYTIKNGFKRVLIGLSGGIDSSLVAALAVDALGKEAVCGITMPSRFNSAETISDAGKLAENLGIEFYTVPIGEALDEFNSTLGKVGGWSSEGLAYENLQARIRGTILMSLSNQLGALVLTTGNKSETAVGYSTLYGDTAGGFAVIKDVYKTQVYRLAEYINQRAGKDLIPRDVITRIPSAELREHQKDTDSLPDYDILDEVLKGYIELDKSAKELIDEGLDEKIVKWVIRAVDRNEYKRRQSPPGVKITPKAFGKDRRMPIVNKYTSFGQ
ncbi:MAG: NAD+ synthase [Phycisphaerae bacterium]|nr:NAD+ synthase [Phycisphaerae bacterium]